MKIKLIQLLNRLLRFFGLMTIQHAREIFVGLTALRERVIMNDVQIDFGVLPRPDYKKTIKEWAGHAFDQAVNDDRIAPIFITEEEKNNDESLGVILNGYNLHYDVK